jgi:hypothetical protein
MSEYSKNVFMLWLENKKDLPFFVRRWTWSMRSSFLVTEILFSPKDEKYYEKTGNLYGIANGYFCVDFTPVRPEMEKLSCSGCYQWMKINHVPHGGVIP